MSALSPTPAAVYGLTVTGAEVNAVSWPLDTAPFAEHDHPCGRTVPRAGTHGAFCSSVPCAGERVAKLDIHQLNTYQNNLHLHVDVVT